MELSTGQNPIIEKNVMRGERPLKKLGVIAGMGPMATVTFLKKIIELTDAQIDQDHINMVIEHLPSIPDRTAYILDPTKPSPLPMMLAAGRNLVKSGAEEIAIPCVTAHYFRRELSDALSVPVLDGIEEAGRCLKELGVKTCGILATQGTIHAGLFEKCLKSYHISWIYPALEDQNRVTEIIYSCVKAGKPVDKAAFTQVIDCLRRQGAEVIVLGCTELSVMADSWLPDGTFLDVLDCLARCCVRDFGYEKKQKFA